MLGEGFVQCIHFWEDAIHLELIVGDLHHKPLKNKDKYFVPFIFKTPPQIKHYSDAGSNCLFSVPATLMDFHVTLFSE